MKRNCKKYHLCVRIYRDNDHDDSELRYRLVVDGDVFYVPTYKEAIKLLLSILIRDEL